MLLSEHVCCVAVTFKVTEWAEQRICINFCIKLEHSSTETIWMLQKAEVMGKWWLEASSQQHACSCIMSHAEFFGKISNHPDDSVPLQPRCGTLRPLDFPQTKITFERGEISDHWMRLIKIWQGSWWQLGELCEVPRWLLWRGLRHHCPTYNVSCILYLLW